MSCRIIDEILNIQSCSIADLSQETKDQFIKQFNGDGIETLTLFYDKKNDIVVLNRDNKDYDFYELTATTYIGAADETRKEIKKQAREINECFSETFSILDQVIKNREIELLKKKYWREFFLIGEQTNFWKQKDVLKAIDIVDEYDSTYMKLTSAYNWGYIQGVRAARARKNKAVE